MVVPALPQADSTARLARKLKMADFRVQKPRLHSANTGAVCLPRPASSARLKVLAKVALAQAS